MSESKSTVARRVILKGLAAGVLLVLGWLLTARFLSRSAHAPTVSWLPVIAAAAICTAIFFSGKDPFWRWCFYSSILFSFFLRFLLLRSNAVYRFIWAGSGWGLADRMRDTPLYVLLAALFLTGTVSFFLDFFQRRAFAGPSNVVPPLAEPPLSVSMILLKGFLDGIVFLFSWILTCHFTFSASDPPGITMHISVIGMMLSVLILNWRGSRCWGWSYLTAVLVSSSVSVFLFLSRSPVITQSLFGVSEFTDGLGNFQTLAVLMLSGITFRRKLLTAVFVLIVREFKRIIIFYHCFPKKGTSTKA